MREKTHTRPTTPEKMVTGAAMLLWLVSLHTDTPTHGVFYTFSPRCLIAIGIRTDHRSPILADVNARVRVCLRAVPLTRTIPVTINVKWKSHNIFKQCFFYMRGDGAKPVGIT